jgi:hypothetical protein
MKTEFETSDIYLASAISLWLKIFPSFKIVNDRAVFVFPVSEDLYGAINDFNSGELSRYVLLLKRLRSEMYFVRKTGGCKNV